MKISHDSKRVTFKTEPRELFETEKFGAKPNTVRILDINEYDGVALVEADRYQHGIIDVIQILKGKITLLTEKEIKNAW